MANANVWTLFTAKLAEIRDRQESSSTVDDSTDRPEEDRCDVALPNGEVLVARAYPHSTRQTDKRAAMPYLAVLVYLTTPQALKSRSGVEGDRTYLVDERENKALPKSLFRSAKIRHENGESESVQSILDGIADELESKELFDWIGRVEELDEAFYGLGQALLALHRERGLASLHTLIASKEQRFGFGEVLLGEQTAAERDRKPENGAHDQD